MPTSVKVDGEVDMTVTVDDTAAVTHIRLEGAGLTGSSLPSDYAHLVFGSTFDAEVDLAPRRVDVRPPGKATVVAALVRTG